MQKKPKQRQHSRVFVQISSDGWISYEWIRSCQSIGLYFGFMSMDGFHASGWVSFQWLGLMDVDGFRVCGWVS